MLGVKTLPQSLAQPGSHVPQGIGWAFPGRSLFPEDALGTEEFV